MNGQPCCHIVCAGTAGELSLKRESDDFVIAADGGYLLCRNAHIEPDLYIGDADSLPAELLSEISCPRVDLPVEKDDTDTLAAVKEGLARGFSRFELYAALGGDLGHTLANIQTLLYLRKAGAHGVLHGAGQDLYLVLPEDGSCTVPTSPGCRVSVFSWTPEAIGVCEKGLKWELEDAELSGSFPLGVSNEALGDEAHISVAKGVLAAVVG
ncbi:MAG: thiamine diphosphokinase [Coriobacteriales bacterium]|jgi:thiamine pyrophosphokinase